MVLLLGGYAFGAICHPLGRWYRFGCALLCTELFLALTIGYLADLNKNCVLSSLVWVGNCDLLSGWSVKVVQRLNRFFVKIKETRTSP